MGTLQPNPDASHLRCGGMQNVIVVHSTRYGGAEGTGGPLVIQVILLYDYSTTTILYYYTLLLYCSTTNILYYCSFYYSTTLHSTNKKYRS